MESTITSKGQITIPIDVRKALGLKEGSKVFFVIEGFRVKMMSRMEYAFYQADQAMDENLMEEYGIHNDEELFEMLRKNKEDIWE